MWCKAQLSRFLFLAFFCFWRFLIIEFPILTPSVCKLIWKLTMTIEKPGKQPQFWLYTLAPWLYVTIKPHTRNAEVIHSHQIFNITVFCNASIQVHASLTLRRRRYCSFSSKANHFTIKSHFAIKVGGRRFWWVCNRKNSKEMRPCSKRETWKMGKACKSNIERWWGMNVVFWKGHGVKNTFLTASRI